MRECFLDHFEVGTVEAKIIGIFDDFFFFCFLFQLGVAFSDCSQVALDR